MSKLLKVIRIEMRKKVHERIIKTRRQDYVRGGYKLEETIFRSTVVVPAALLECGHWRVERQCGTVISIAKKLSCFECEISERNNKIF
jgi:hypothetical protein